MSAAGLRIAVVGGGPAGLMAAEVARAAGAEVDLYERLGSVGRKFLIAGKGGLNLTHSEPRAAFQARYGERAAEVGRWLDAFDADALREWARGLGVETFVGSSGRVFPADLKAAPLLRGWVRRLRSQGARLHMHHRLSGWTTQPGRAPRLQFSTPAGVVEAQADAVILALGGGSWPQLGSDGAWVPWLREQGIDVAELAPSNGGFAVAWSEHLRSRHAGAPLKSVGLHWRARDGRRHQRQGELILTADGLEGGLIYAASADLRHGLQLDGNADITLDLLPTRSGADLAADLASPRKGRSLGEHLRRKAGLDGVRAALVFETRRAGEADDAATLARLIKAIPLRLTATRPLAEAISSAGGVRLEALTPTLMARAQPGVFCAGEMLDWEAPTGGYLLTASYASGLWAARGALEWAARPPA